ncbi:DUF2752 domain-containing protein [Salinimicrobium xinjiangense]|uniref:DUF2752 domain-containing protein n=1 Tax=Salinimicrobium xinjiangense TaxID=438596 RepID=UPI001B7FB850|nr:DUF2752 domain-containing protein [Salinimicrobium xinjiangense]
MTAFFPACPFYTYTGFLCPGCGSQRAIHHLLNFHFSGALTQNPLMVLSLPYVLAGLIIDRLPHYSPAIRKWRQVLFGRKAIYIILAAIISFWIFRNL